MHVRTTPSGGRSSGWGSAPGSGWSSGHADSRSSDIDLPPCSASRLRRPVACGCGPESRGCRVLRGRLTVPPNLMAIPAFRGRYDAFDDSGPPYIAGAETPPVGKVLHGGFARESAHNASAGHHPWAGAHIPGYAARNCWSASAFGCHTWYAVGVAERWTAYAARHGGMLRPVRAGGGGMTAARRSLQPRGRRGAAAETEP